MIYYKRRRYILMLFLLQIELSIMATLNVGMSVANAISIQTNGKILAAGYVMLNDIPQLMLARYTAFGTIDTIYGYDGYVATPVGTNASANGVTILSNDQAIIAGLGQSSAGDTFTIARYNTNGTLDITFNTTGIVTRLIGTGACAYGITVDSSNRYIVAGTAIIGGAPIIAVARYNSDGTPDTSFDSSGVAVKRIFGNAGAYDVALQTTGKIVTAGYAVNGAIRQFGLVRFNTDGSVDTTFGSSGTLVTPIGYAAAAYALAIQSNNYIIAAGTGSAKFALVRYKANGAMDTTFGSAGIVTTPIGANAQINDIALQSDGKIVAVGFSDNSIALARYNTNGSLDTTFGSSGIVTTAVGTAATGSSLAFQINGQIVVSGSSDNGTIVLRYNSDGSLDTTFAHNGIINFPNRHNAPDIFGIANNNVAADANISYSKLNLGDSIMDSDISANAAIANAKLAPLATPGLVLNAATTATSFEVPGTIIARDTLGNFSANMIFADITGNVIGNASDNLLKSGDTMAGVLILPAGSSVTPSLQFSGNRKTGLSSVSDTLAISTQGLERVTIDDNGSVTINRPNADTALTVNGETLIAGDISNSGNIAFNTAALSLNSVGSTQGPLMKMYCGVSNTGLAGVVTIDYTAAGFTSVPIICMNPINGISATLTIKSITNSSAMIMSGSTLNVPFNYIAIGI